jgi:hypothetical protein
MPEATDQDLEGSRLITELGRDILRRPSLDEDGTQGFIAAMEGGLGLEEEAPARLVVHGVGSHQLTVFRRPGALSVAVAPQGARGWPGRPPGDFRGCQPPREPRGAEPGQFWGCRCTAAPAGK